MSANKTDPMCFKQERAVSTLNDKFLQTHTHTYIHDSCNLEFEYGYHVTSFPSNSMISTNTSASSFLEFPYLSSSISSTESDVNIRLVKAWTDIDRFAIIWKSDLSEEMRWDFFQAVTVSVL